MVKNAIIQTDHLLSFPVELPVPGKVNVHLGQLVEQGDIIAEAVLPAKFQVFDVINQFRIKESGLDSCLKRLAGEDVQRGDVIAKKSGLISRFFRAPEDGKVVAIRDGRVTLAMGEKVIQAQTPIGGTVGELIPGLGAVIVVRGFSLRGSWGNGKTAIGQLVMLDEVKESDLAKVKDAIVYLNSVARFAELKTLCDNGAAGILVAALDPASKIEIEQLNMPVMSLLGFGEAALDQLSRSAIEELQNSQVTLLARRADPYRDVKPELFQPSESVKTAELFAEPEPTLIGQTARLLGQPYFGSVGKIVELPEKTERTASGMKSKVAVIKREDETIIRVPLENLEILTC
ncbi:MAG TPA: hypothetical protein DD636_03965 [Anaerolineaceae bacterium]|jgi:hypothetical protein|nr:hypothetical protein [Anaerolineaceae bacterium]